MSASLATVTPFPYSLPDPLTSIVNSGTLTSLTGSHEESLVHTVRAARIIFHVPSFVLDGPYTRIQTANVSNCTFVR